MNIGNKIKFYRRKKKLTQETLADLLDVSKQTIINYENSKSDLSTEKIIELSKVLDIEPYKFFIDDLSLTQNTNLGIRKVPIISHVSAGKGYLGEDQVLEVLDIPISLCNKCDFGTFVKGDSMEPLILDGDIILIEKKIELQNGDIGIFKYKEEVFCKKFRCNNLTKEVTLESLNRDYPPIYIEHNKDIVFYVIGKVSGTMNFNF